MEEPRHSKKNKDRWLIDKDRYRLDLPPAPKRNISRVSDVLTDVVKGLEKPINENVQVLKKSWPKLCGEQIAKHSEPVFLKDHILSVLVDLPGFLPELQRIKKLILQKIQSQYPMMEIRSIQFRLAHK